MKCIIRDCDEPCWTFRTWVILPPHVSHPREITVPLCNHHAGISDGGHFDGKSIAFCDQQKLAELENATPNVANATPLVAPHRKGSEDGGTT